MHATGHWAVLKAMCPQGALEALSLTESDQESKDCTHPCRLTAVVLMNCGGYCLFVLLVAHAAWL